MARDSVTAGHDEASATRRETMKLEAEWWQEEDRMWVMPEKKPNMAQTGFVSGLFSSPEQMEEAAREFQRLAAEWKTTKGAKP
jgi:hypothetical protein